jgi:uncharacterized protein (UPF0216 family)
VDRENFLDVMLQSELRKLNTHLPKNRKTVRELLAEDPPTVSTVGGEKVTLKKSEVEALSAELPDVLRAKVKLPIVLMRRRDLGAGAFTLLGDPYEEYALSKILGDFKGTLADFTRSRESSTVFYKPQISELMRRFHSLIVVGFGLSE